MSKMTNCKACGKEIAKGAKCPSCGKDQRNFFMKHKILSVVIGLVVIGGIGSIGNSGSKTNTPTSGTPTQSTSTNTQKEVEKPKYEILEHKAIEEDGVKYIVGKIKNNTGKQIGYAQVEINLYDANGQQLGSTMTNINNLEVNGVWNFKALVTEDNYKSYKIMNVSGF